MIVEAGLDSLARVPAGGTMSIGNFDGVHLGHVNIVRAARSLADAVGGECVVVTFEPHPLTVLRPALAPPRLSPTSAKQARLSALGVDRLIVLPPSPEVLNLTAEAFFAILRNDAKVRHLVEGANFNFGKARGGNIERLREWCARDGVGLTIVEEVEVALSDRSVVAVSSSLIRWLLAYGRVHDAALCLGRPYTLEGVVVHGEKRGRTIGFPTANIACGEQLLPAAGVYAGTCVIDELPRRVALSIGTNPQFDGTRVTVEAYVLDFAGDLYDRRLEVAVTEWIREQRTFPSVELLVEQLHRDVASARAQPLGPAGRA